MTGAPSTIGARLKAERKRLGASQRSFADIAGMSVRAFIDWEQDRTSPHAAALAAFSRAGADITYIVAGYREPADCRAVCRALADAIRTMLALVEPPERIMILVDLLAAERNA